MTTTKLQSKKITKATRMVLFLSVPLVLFLTSHFSLLTSVASADELSLKIVPSVIQIRTQTPATLSAPFVIENQSNQSIKLKIAYKLLDSEKSQNGAVVFLENPGKKNDIFNYVQVVDSNNTSFSALDLGPKQQKQLQLRVQLPQNFAPTDRYFSLLFLHDVTPKTDQNSTIRDKKNQSTISTIQGGIGTNVFLAIGAPETAQGYIEEFSTPWYRQSGPVPFSLKIKNNGLHYINPKGTIVISNIFGQTVGRVDIPSTTILAGTTRSLIDQKQFEEAIQPNNEQKAIWTDRLLFGVYNASLTMAMDKEGPIYTRSIRFLVFPIHLLLGFIAVVALGIIIYIRVKKRIS